MHRPRHASSVRPRRIGRWLVGVPLAAVVATGSAFAWDAVTMLDARDDLTSGAAAAKQALGDRDVEALTSQVAGLETAARGFAHATDGPHWWVAAHLPWVKDQVRPLIAAGDAVDAMASEALAPLAQMGSLDALAVPGFEDGRIDPATLEPYRAALAQASAALTEQGEALAAVDLTATDARVAAPFRDLRDRLAEVATLVEGGHVAAELLPTMLGGEGARTYLVMVQNNAEPRATGGIPGAVIEITVEDGRIEMGRYSGAGPMVVEDGVGGLTDDEQRIFGSLMETYPQDVTFTPEYPRAAEMMARFWDRAYGGDVDGVISVDPVALGWMLEGAAPVEVGPFEITGENLADVMLNESYLEYPDPEDQDAFFARASAELFGRIVSGDANAVDGITRAIEAGRFRVWAADAQEQSLLAPTVIAGDFLGRSDAAGVFVNDGSESKIGYYVDMQASSTVEMCTGGGAGGQSIDVTFTHTFDGDVADLPWYVAGNGVKVEKGSFAGNVMVYPPVGSGVTSVTRDGEPTALTPDIHDGRHMSAVWIELQPGQTTTLHFELTAPASGGMPETLWATPGATPPTAAPIVKHLVDDC